MDYIDYFFYASGVVAWVIWGFKSGYYLVSSLMDLVLKTKK